MRKTNKAIQNIIVVLACIALLAVLSGFFLPPQPDEGTPAHIFQISIALLVPCIVAFFLTAHLSAPFKTFRRLAAPAMTLVVAFGALYYLEHVR